MPDNALVRRFSKATFDVAFALQSSDQGEGLSAPELLEITGLRAGTLYGILTTFERRGWIEIDLERVSGRGGGSRQRYRLSETKRHEVSDQIVRYVQATSNQDSTVPGSELARRIQ